jgi:hypothetical protein
MLSYKAPEYGVAVVYVDPRYTSQRCSKCGHTSRKNRPSRERFVCEKCKHTEHADLNAAKNIAANWSTSQQNGAPPVAVSPPHATDDKDTRSPKVGRGVRVSRVAKGSDHQVTSPKPPPSGGGCLPAGKVLLNAKLQEWWTTSEKATDMMTYLGWWVDSKGNDSPEHREAVRILLLCVRTAPDLPAEDRHALDLLEAWSQGGEDRRHEAKELAFSWAVKDIAGFSTFAFYDGPRYVIEKVLEVVAFLEHEHLLADLIRQEMPLSPLAK